MWHTAVDAFVIFLYFHFWYTIKLHFFFRIRKHTENITLTCCIYHIIILQCVLTTCLHIIHKAAVYSCTHDTCHKTQYTYCFMCLIIHLTIIILCRIDDTTIRRGVITVPMSNGRKYYTFISSFQNQNNIIVYVGIFKENNTHLFYYLSTDVLKHVINSAYLCNNPQYY